MFDPDTMRKRFVELGEKRKQIEGAAAETRARYEALLAQEQALKAQIRPALDALKAVEQPLFAIDQERAIIVRALNGRTGEAG